MVGEVFAGIGAFKAAMDIAKSLKDMDSAASRNAAVVELTEKIITAQAAQQELIARVGELEKELVRFENWEAEKQRYQLQEVGRGSLVYTSKPAMADGEPMHHICQNCYQEGHKSILQKESRSREEYLVCQRCKADLPLSGIRRDS